MRKLFHPKTIILLFLLIGLILPFYESNRVIMWQTQGQTQTKNIFRSLLLFYAEESEKLKREFGLDEFFRKESAFWKKIKESPLIFQSIFVKEKMEESVKEEIPKEETVEEGAEERAVENKKEIPKKKRKEDLPQKLIHNIDF